MLRKSYSTRSYYLKGGWNVICDRCGFKKKNTEVKLEWDNLIVCKEYCWEPRQPQDFVRAIPDMKPVPMARPDSDPQFLDNQITPEDL
jgi:hypothetical protein